jgi:tripartite-type tricarboxylate transporter receptor subunit TctC
VNYASPGRGSVHHLATEMLKQQTGADLTHVPYKGGAALAAALLDGQVQAMIESPSAYLGHIRAGRLRALAVTGDRRLAALPGVPTFEEQGIHGRLNTELRAVLGDPQLAGVLEKTNVTPMPGSPEAFGANIAQEWQRWRGFAARSGLKLDD